MTARVYPTNQKDVIVKAGRLAQLANAIHEGMNYHQIPNQLEELTGETIKIPVNAVQQTFVSTLNYQIPAPWQNPAVIIDKLKILFDCAAESEELPAAWLNIRIDELGLRVSVNRVTTKLARVGTWELLEATYANKLWTIKVMFPRHG